MIELSLLFLIHWCADFVCQTDKMATQKSTSWKWLSIHVGVYSTPITLYALAYNFNTPIKWSLLFGVVTFITHFITDACTSRMTSYFWQKGDRHNFFVIIGFDQLIHAITLMWTWHWIMTP